jgi:N6-L-threonylcarbamoyladenine synthase
MIILGIETSCDETAAAVIEGHGNQIKVLSNIVSSQIEIHKKYGGVVPEVAAREHVVNILPVINEALERADLTPVPIKPHPTLSKFGEGRSKSGVRRGLDAIAVTVGPGLITSLLVGVETAKTLAYVWQSPVVAVNHIEGHIYANWLPPIGNVKCQMSNVKNNIKFPVVILTVSGGHTMLVLMKGHGRYKILGETRDDAAGEAFDKAAQLLGLGYPGGPAMAAEAAKCRMSNVECRINKLPRPMIKDKSFDFSFSGLKTALLYEISKDKVWRKKVAEYCVEFQQAIIDVLTSKTIRAAKEYKVKTVMLSGGVAANLELRHELEQKVRQEVKGAKFLMPEIKYCTDNAAMVAAAGYFRAKQKKFTPWQKLKVDANMELK